MKDPEINPMNLSFSFMWRGVIVYKNEVTGKWFVATASHKYDPESAVGATPEDALDGWYKEHYPESAVGAT